MDQLIIKPDSLEGRALYILNMLRGGITNDDDSYDTRMLRDDILNVSASVLQQELIARDSAGLDYDADLLIVDTLDLTAEEVTLEEPVTLFYVPRPKTLQFRGNPLITYIQSPFEPRSWTIANNMGHAIRFATSRPNRPAWPAYWLDGDRIRIALPNDIGLVRTAHISYAPANLDEFPDGTKRDIYEDPFPLSRRLWSQVWPQVYKNAGGTLIQTSPNRDETNNGADVTVQPS